MLFVPAPEVMTPLVMDQAYVAPAPAEGTEARLSARLAQTAAGPETVPTGGPLTARTAAAENFVCPKPSVTTTS
jgi:hypothetical protein